MLEMNTKDGISKEKAKVNSERTKDNWWTVESKAKFLHYNFSISFPCTSEQCFGTNIEDAGWGYNCQGGRNNYGGQAL